VDFLQHPKHVPQNLYNLTLLLRQLPFFLRNCVQVKLLVWIFTSNENNPRIFHYAIFFLVLILLLIQVTELLSFEEIRFTTCCHTTNKKVLHPTWEKTIFFLFDLLTASLSYRTHIDNRLIIDIFAIIFYRVDTSLSFEETCANYEIRQHSLSWFFVFLRSLNFIGLLQKLYIREKKTDSFLFNFCCISRCSVF
jgi:hypothetical protein